MEIKEHIKKIEPYFREMQITTIDDGTQVIYVVTKFPHGWVISDELGEKFDVTVTQGNEPDLYFFCCTIDTGEEKLFEAIEYNVDKMKSAIERAKLLREKIAELQDLFGNEEISLESLKTLTFDYDKTNVVSSFLTGKKKKDKDQEKNNKKNEDSDE